MNGGAANINPIPDGHPYDQAAEAAGREMWEFIREWRQRHSVTRVQYLWIANRMMAEELRGMSLAEVEEYNRRMGHVSN